MKNYIKIGFLSIVTALTLSSCGEDYLDKKPEDDISTIQFAKAVKDRPYLLKGNLRGIYKAMFDRFTGGTEGHDDFGQKGYDIFSDMLSQDMALSRNTYGWYGGISDMTATQDFASLKNYIPWRYYYRLIYASNIVLDAAKNEDGTYKSDEESKSNVGQALALRAYSYFMLLNLYCKDFTSSEKILPIYKDAGTVGNPPEDAPTVLNLVIEDLEKAVEFLPNFIRKSKNEVNMDIAQVMLAYAYGDKGENMKAYEQLKDVIDRGGYPILKKDVVAYNDSTRTGNGFNNVESDNWIWGQKISVDDGLNLVSWWGQMDYFTYSYAAFGDFKAVDSGLFEKIGNNDVRKNWFYNNASSPFHLMPLNKFYDPARIRGGQRTITTDYVYMRIEEVYLLAAEYASKLGKEAEAKKYLKVVLDERLDDTSYIDALSGSALLDEILLQTRIEMWGEGKSYLLMKRNKTTVTRGNNHLTFQGESYQYNDDKLTFEVPQKEIENNPYYN